MLRALALDLARDIASLRYQRFATAVLLLIGLGLWGPLLARNVIGTSPANRVRVEQPLPVVEAEASFAADAPATEPASTTAIVQTAMLPAESQVQPPSVTMPATPAVEPAPGDTDATDALRLESTIVGVSRRAALINGRMYLAGAEVHADGAIYKLEEIDSRRVVLRGADGEVELTMPSTTR